MFRTTLRTIVMAIAVSAAYSSVSDKTVSAQGPYPPDMFANYYVGPPGVPAQLYVSPRPVPAFVGHTWITYQPLEPHEFLYHHKRTYLRHHPGASPTKTTITWH
jgi:hypothetical protein